MVRLTAALLLAGCFVLPMQAQAPQEQSPAPQAQTEQPPAAQQKTAEQNPAEQNQAATPAAAGTETTEYPLEKFQTFSAMQSGTQLPGWKKYRHIYRNGKLLRQEGDQAGGSYYITDLDTRGTTSVDTHGCMKVSMPYPLSFPFFLKGPGFKYQRISIGEETVDGHKCKVEDIKTTDPKHKAGVRAHFRLYEAEDLDGFPIQIEGKHDANTHWVIHYKDVKLGPQDESLFMIPIKCSSGDEIIKHGATSKPKAAAPKPPTK